MNFNFADKILGLESRHFNYPIPSIEYCFLWKFLFVPGTTRFQSESNIYGDAIKFYRSKKKTRGVWQYGLWSFQTGGTKLERFLPKNQLTQRILLNFENWVSGEVSKSAKSPNLLTFKVNFLYQKSSEAFSIFFSLKNINLGAHFLLLTFFDNINF